MVRAVLALSEESNFTTSTTGTNTIITVTYENEPADVDTSGDVTDEGWYKNMRNFHDYPYQKGAAGAASGNNFPATHNPLDGPDPGEESFPYQHSMSPGTAFILRKSSQVVLTEGQDQAEEENADQLLSRRILGYTANPNPDPSTFEVNYLIIRYPSGIAWCFTEPIGEGQDPQPPVPNKYFLNVIPITFATEDDRNKMAVWFGDFIPTAFSCTDNIGRMGNFTKRFSQNEDYNDRWCTDFYCGEESLNPNVVEVHDVNSQPFGYAFSEELAVNQLLLTSKPFNSIQLDRGQHLPTYNPLFGAPMPYTQWGAGSNSYITVGDTANGVFHWDHYSLVQFSGAVFGGTNYPVGVNTKGLQSFYVHDVVGNDDPASANPIELRSYLFPYITQDRGASPFREEDYDSQFMAYAAFGLPQDVSIWSNVLPTSFPGDLWTFTIELRYYINEGPFDTISITPDNGGFGWKVETETVYTSTTLEGNTEVVDVRSLATIPDRCVLIRIVLRAVRSGTQPDYNPGTATMFGLGRRAANGTSGEDEYFGIFQPITPRPTPYAMFSLGEDYFCPGKQLTLSSEPFPTP